MEDSGYARFCPTAMAASILEPRWTMLILCELFSGAARFGEIQAGLPGLSPSLLSRRLKELMASGLVLRHESAGGVVTYRATATAEELEPLLHGLGEWAHRNIDPEIGLREIDHRMLMWNIRRKIDVSALPRRRAVVQFTLREDGTEPVDYWLLIRPNAETDLCVVDPKQNVDLFILSDLRALARAWVGHSSFSAEISAGRIELIGDADMASSLTRWMLRSSFACDPSPRAVVE